MTALISCVMVRGGRKVWMSYVNCPKEGRLKSFEFRYSIHRMAWKRANAHAQWSHSVPLSTRAGGRRILPVRRSVRPSHFREHRRENGACEPPEQRGDRAGKGGREGNIQITNLPRCRIRTQTLPGLDVGLVRLVNCHRIYSYSNLAQSSLQTERLHLVCITFCFCCSAALACLLSGHSSDGR